MVIVNRLNSSSRSDMKSILVNSMIKYWLVNWRIQILSLEFFFSFLSLCFIYVLVIITQILGLKDPAKKPILKGDYARWKVNLSAAQWDILGDLEIVLNPFKQFTCMVSYKSRPTISLLLPSLYEVQQTLGICDISAFQFDYSSEFEAKYQTRFKSS